MKQLLIWVKNIIKYMAIHLRSQHITNMYTPIELISTDNKSVYVYGGSGVTDHGYLHGLEDNDHPQYLLSSNTTKFLTADSSINTSNFLLTDAAQSFIYTSDSSNFIALSNSSEFALSDHTHSIGAFLTTAALSNHSHGSVDIISTTGDQLRASSASSGLTVAVPAYLTTYYGISPIIASDSQRIDLVNGQLSFANSNGITFGMEVNSGSDGGVIVTAKMEYPDQVGILGISDGVNSIQTNSSIKFADAHGISFRLNGSTMTASYTVPAATVFSNSNNVEFGLSGSTITALANFSQTVQTQSPTQIIIDGNTTGYGPTAFSTGTLTLYGGDNITLNQGDPNYIEIIGNNALNVSLTGNISGTVAAISSGNIYFAGGNNITLSQNGSSITISGPNVGAAQTSIAGIAGSNTTFTSGTVYMSGQNNLTIGSFVTSNSQYIRFSVGNYLTTAAATNHTHGSNVSTASTTGTDFKFSSASNGLTMGAPVFSTTYMPLASSTRLVGTGFTTVSTTGTNIAGTLNTNGLNLAVPKYLTTAATGGGGGSISLSLSLLSGSVSNATNGMTVSLTGPVVSNLVNTSQIGTMYFMDVVGLSWSSSVSSNSTSIYPVLP